MIKFAVFSILAKVNHQATKKLIAKTNDRKESFVMEEWSVKPELEQT